MNAKKTNKSVKFKTVEEYLAFYSTAAKDKPSKGSKYYRVGEGVARMACEKATHNLQAKSM
jgi:hypothetical protein